MTNEEAIIAEHIDECNKRINVIKTHMNILSNGVIDECKHNIEVLETAIRVAEKQIPKKPDYEGDGCDNDGNIICNTWICPNCEEHYEVDYDNYECCPHCGQRLDWSEYDK